MKAPPSSSFVVVLLGAVALMLPGLGCERRSEQVVDSAGAAIAAAELRWPVQRRLRYRLELTSSSTMTMAGATPFKVELQANADVLPIEAQGKRVAVLLRLREPRLTFDRVRSTESAELEAELGKPFWFAVEDGRIIDGRVVRGVSAQAVSILRSISAALQLSAPQQPQGGAWQASEFDSTGRYEASYTASAPGVVTKKKVRYVDTLISGKADLEQRNKVLPEVLQSLAKLSVRDGLLERVTLEDELRSTLIGTNQVTVKHRVSLTLDTGAKPAQPSDFKLAEELVPLPPSQAYGDTNIRAQFDAVRAEGAHFKDVLAALEAAEAKDKRPLVTSINDVKLGDDAQDEARSELGRRVDELTKLVGLLRTQPDTVAQTERAILAKSPAATVLADGLGTADTPASQAALVSLLQGGQLSKELQVPVATSLIRVRTPSAETVTFLRSLSKDPLLKDHAVYGLGTAARRLKEGGDVARSDAIVDELLQGLAQASSSDERYRFLRGIANSASVKALPAVLPYLEDAKANVRQAALDALRLMQDPRVDTVVQTRLRDEKDPQVRRVALRLAQRRPPADMLVDAVVLAARSDSDSTVRSAALALLEEWAPKRESLLPIIQELKAAAARIAADSPLPTTP